MKNIIRVAGVSMKYRFDKSQLTVSDSIFCSFIVDDSVFKRTDTTIVTVVIAEDYTKANFNHDFFNYDQENENKYSCHNHFKSETAEKQTGSFPLLLLMRIKG